MSLSEGLLRYLSPAVRKAVSQARVGIAGLGGLGSNRAMRLVCTAPTRLLWLHCGRVEPSNLNRQHYFPHHVACQKTEALAAQMRALCSSVSVDVHSLWITEANVTSLLDLAPVWVEALDAPESKRFFVEAALQAGRFTVSASGMAGVGGEPMQKRSLGEHLVLVGDFTSDVAVLPPLAPRVMQAAALQADAVLEHVLGATQVSL